MIPFLYHYKRKWPNTNRIKIAFGNRILPPLGIWWKNYTESKSHLELRSKVHAFKKPLTSAHSALSFWFQHDN
jgi:hypothetical protein